MSPVSSSRTPRDLGQQHHAGLVGRAAVTRSDGRRVRRRPEHLEGDVADGARLAVRSPPPSSDPSSAASAATAATPPGGSASRVTSTSPTSRSVEHAREPVDVVGVEVGQHQQRHPVHPEPAQTAVDRTRVGAGVDDDGRTRSAARSTRASPWPTSQAANTQPAGGHPGVGGPTTVTATSSRQAAAPEVRWRSTTGPAATTAAVVTTRKASDHGVVPQSSAAPGSAAPCSATDHDPRDAPARQGADEPAQQVRDQTDHAAQQPQDRGRTDHGRHDQVGGDGHQADLAGDAGDQRRARQLGRRRHRDRLREPPRQPARQGVAPRRRDQQDAGGRQHREREPRRARQARARRAAARRPPRRGRGRPGASHPGPARPGPRPPWRPPAARWARCGPAARSRRSRPRRRRRAIGRGPPPSGRPRAGTRPRGSGWCPRRPSGASGRWSGSRRPARAASRRRRRRPAPAPAPAGWRAGGPPRRGSTPAAPRWPARPRPRPSRSPGGPRGVTVRSQVAGVLDGRQPAGEADPFPDGHPRPVVVAEHQDGLVPTHRDPHEHPVAEATLDPPWVARHRARQGHQGALLGGRRDRAVAHRLGPDQRHHADTSQAHGHHRRPR